MITPDPKFPEIKLITPEIHCDNRGWFMEIHREGLGQRYIQTNLVYFTQRVLRGLDIGAEYKKIYDRILEEWE